MKNRSRFALSTTQIIMFSFLLVILLGSALLALPISSADGVAVPYIDALFTATTATCVTGLVTLTTFSAWSSFGHVVILILIQLGGLGIITVIAGFMVALNRKMGLRDSMILSDAFNLTTLSGLSKFVKRVICGTLVIEGVGALLYMTVFVPDFGARGIWISVFTAVSAFCNAGIDIIADNSLCNYVDNATVNFVTMALITLGGLGFIVWWDVLRVLKDFRAQRLKCLRRLTLHSKIVLAASVIITLGGALLIFIFEYGNPETIGELSLFGKIQASLFQSVTTRTAGFASVPQESLSSASVVVCVIMMFIGASPVGTGGGIKTVTVVVLLCTAYSAIRNKNEISLFNRNISRQATRKAVAVTCMSFAITFVSTLLLAAVSDFSLVDILYETVSATGTVGLTRGITSQLSLVGKVIITATMYLGRIGPISLAFLFGSEKEITNNIKNPTEEISVG